MRRNVVIRDGVAFPATAKNAILRRTANRWGIAAAVSRLEST
jgi:hypothetical protein